MEILQIHFFALPLQPNLGIRLPGLVVQASADDENRALSSVGLEHLPYKQRVGGSNPSAPTTSYT